MSPRLFTDLQLNETMLKALRKMGFIQLTPIQSEAIPILLQGRDVIGQAQTGTGKTATFGVPLILKVDEEANYIQGLILVPTRELAEQVSNSLKGLARYTGIRVVVFHGGDKLITNLDVLKKPIHIVVGTPGRLIDLIKRRAVDLSKTRVVVIDEADKLLEMGFIKGIEYILSKTPYVRQTSLWSATLSPEVLDLSTRYMRHPRKILVSQEEVAQANVDQYYVMAERNKKQDLIEKLLKDEASDRAIIFCNKREATEALAEKLVSDGFLVVSLHGRYTQSQRDEALESFKLKKAKYLVSTDVAGRGLDISGVPYIINYDVPEDPEVYFHRIGRTARIGETGTSITIVTPEDELSFNSIRDMTNTEIKELKL